MAHLNRIPRNTIGGVKIAGTPKYFKVFNKAEFDPAATGITGLSEPVEKSVFVNNVEVGSLSLKKEVEGTAPDSDVKFVFEIALSYIIKIIIVNILFKLYEFIRVSFLILKFRMI